MKQLLIISLFILRFSAIGQVTDSAAVAREVDSLIQISRELTGKREFEKALEVNGAAEKIVLENVGKETVMYGSVCFNYGRVFYVKEDYLEAEKWYLESIAIREKMLGKEHPEYAWCLNNLAVLYKAIGNYKQAERLYLEAKSVREKVLGKEHPDYASSLNNLARLYYAIGNSEESERFYLETITIQEKALGKEHPDYASSLINLANLYSHIGQFEKAERLYLEVKSVRKKVLGKEHPDYASILNNLANLYSHTGKFGKAEQLYLEVKSVRERVLGKEHPDYASSLNNLASLYSHIGQFEKAEPLYFESKAIREKVLRKEHPDYARSLNNLASLYLHMSQFEKAEPLYIESKVIQEKVLGKNHTDYAVTLNNLAILYSTMNNYEKAELLYLESKAVREKTLGKEHPDYAQSLNNLANLYRYIGSFEEAELLYLESKAIREKVLGKEHPDYAGNLDDLASLYRIMGNYKKAESLHIEARTVLEKVLGKEHLKYAGSLENLAMLYWSISQYEKAEPLYLESQAIRERVLGKENFDYTASLGNLANLYKDMGNYEKAELLYVELFVVTQSLIEKALQHLSERELDRYLNLFLEEQSRAITFIQLTNSKKATMPCYDNSLFYKGFLLNAAHQIKQLALSDSASTETYYLLKSYRRRLAAQYSRPIVERDSALVATLEEKANTLEKELVRSVAGFGDALRQVTWQEVRDQLRPGEAAIEFVHFKYYTPDPTDSIMYAALLLRPGDTIPHFISLFEEKQLHALLNRPKDNQQDFLAALYAAPRQNATNSSLYELIWKPLDSLLAGAQTLYVSPSGLLHRVNLGAVLISPDRTVADRYRIVSVGSTRQLVVKPAPLDSQPLTVQLYGGIRYDMDSTAIAAAKSGVPSVAGGDLSFSLAEQDRAERGYAWTYLEGSQREVEQIGALVAHSGGRARTLTAYTATEESFKALGQSANASPRVLHIATHGYFYPDPVDTLKRDPFFERAAAFKVSDHPMIRSGLIFAGGNHVWQRNPPVVGLEDGILTAYEASQVDLRNTELVVLSACQTGLGDIEGNEGVYGLQRAFRIAGARYLIMSLWSVPDRQTQEMMTAFYRYWLKKKMPIPEAFRAAQQKMRKKYKAHYYWAGFVLVE